MVADVGLAGFGGAEFLIFNSELVSSERLSAVYRLRVGMEVVPRPLLWKYPPGNNTVL